MSSEPSDPTGTLIGDTGDPSVKRPTLGSMLLGTTNPARLLAWYRAAFGVEPDTDGFIDFGGVAVLIDHRDDVEATNPEPGRLILNFHVDDARAIAARLDTIGVVWLAKLQARDDGQFATLIDSDGNYIQIIELNAEYLAAHSPSTGTAQSNAR